MNINTKEYWDEIWKKENVETWRIYPATKAQILEIIGTKKKVLELGCGVGLLLKEIKKQGNTVAGIDISEEATIIAKKSGELEIVDAYELPPINYSDNFFDFVIAAEFIEHFEDTKTILQEMQRVAKKAIVVVPNNVLGPQECKEHYQKFTKDTLEKELKKYWKDVLVYEFIDIFKTKKVNIRLPCLLGYCIGETKNE